ALPLAPLYFCFCFLSKRSPAPRALPSFPTRRSSDLEHARPASVESGGAQLVIGAYRGQPIVGQPPEERVAGRRRAPLGAGQRSRSEEHTSELQSLTNLVCRLLLEKKKTKTCHDRSTQ